MPARSLDHKPRSLGITYTESQNRKPDPSHEHLNSATKDDVRNLATKNDLKEIKSDVAAVNENVSATNQRVDRLTERVDNIKKFLDESMVTREEPRQPFWTNYLREQTSVDFRLQLMASRKDLWARTKKK